MVARFKNSAALAAGYNKLGFFKAGARLLVLPKSSDEDSARKEFILNVILLTTLAVLVIFDSLVLYNSILSGPNYKGLSFAVFSLPLLVVAALYISSRAGYFKFSAHIFIGALFLLITYSAFRWGADLPAVLMGYALVVITASVLIGTNFGFWLTCVAVAILVTLGFAEIHGHILPDRYWKKQVLGGDNIIEYAIMLFFLTVVSWLSNRGIEKSLLRARHSESQLKLERDNLEVTVEERTRELRESQYRQLSQHSQFVELGQLAGGYVHDLANPLTVLSLSIDQLNRNQFVPASTALGLAMDSCKRMEKLLVTMRKKIRQDESKEWFLVAQELNEAVSLLGHKAAQVQAEVSVSVADDNIKLFGSSAQFHQIVSNLIANAIESYSGAVNEFPRKVKVQLSLKPNAVILAVADYGSGISETDIKRIFQPLFTTKGQNGLGVGLSTIKRIIEQDFGGSIGVASQPGQGTIFTVDLPVKLESYEGGISKSGQAG